MAGSVNRVILVGNLGRDPEARNTHSGGKIVNLAIATSETWNDRNTGERKERTEWHKAALFNEGLCGVAEKYLRKGSKVYIEGELRTRKWQDQNGQTRYSTEVVLSQHGGKLVMLGDHSGDQQSQPAQSRNNQRQSQTQQSGGFDDEVPFL